jgi:cobalt-zinc-cadmium efflux system protein
LLNAIILLVAVGAIILESIHKFASAGTLNVNGAAISWTAGIGIIVNGVTAYLLMRQQKHDINTRGAFLHMLADTLVSVGVVISGIVISATGWTVIDPIISLAIAGIILFSTWNLLTESLRMSIDAVPENIDPDEIIATMSSQEGVLNIHHVHIWPISTEEIALTAHVVIKDLDKMEEITERLKRTLYEKGIQHTTLEMETKSSHCQEHECKCNNS